MSVILGIDLGTSSVKAMLLDSVKGVIPVESSPYEVSIPFEGYAEQNPETWWLETKQVLGRLRDKNEQECDVVIHLRNGKYGLIEIKLGGDKLIEYGAETLKSMEAKIDTGKMNTPSFLMVLTGTGDWAYRRKDGVYVVPIGCLKN